MGKNLPLMNEEEDGDDFELYVKFRKSNTKLTVDTSKFKRNFTNRSVDSPTKSPTINSENDDYCPTSPLKNGWWDIKKIKVGKFRS